MNYPRALAVRVLTRVLSDHQPLDEALESVLGEVPSGSLSWLQDVCSGTLRWKGRLDWILDSVAVKKKPSGWLRKILLVASYQLVVQDRAPMAAVVSETVSEVKKREGEAPAKFANACLRKIGEHAQEWRNLPFRDQAGQKQNALWASLPEWFWSRIVAKRGTEWARAYAVASLERPKLWIRAKRSDWTPTWAEAGPVLGSWQVKEMKPVTELQGYSEGEFIVQDISSQFLIREVTNEIRKLCGDQQLRALDICAAPGGKSIGLSWNGFQVTSTDITEKRIPLLMQNVSRLAPSIDVVKWDELGQVGTKDLIWVDAPCSGTGILRRHPDVRWLRQEKELEGLINAQKKVLKESWEKVSSGGFLVYSVCSVLKEEGEELVSSSNLSGVVLKQWLLSPQDSPGGDGFWGILIQKK